MRLRHRLRDFFLVDPPILVAIKVFEHNSKSAAAGGCMSGCVSAEGGVGHHRRVLRFLQAQHSIAVDIPPIKYTVEPSTKSRVVEPTLKAPSTRVLAHGRGVLFSAEQSVAILVVLRHECVGEIGSEVVRMRRRRLRNTSLRAYCMTSSGCDLLHGLLLSSMIGHEIGVLLLLRIEKPVAVHVGIVKEPAEVLDGLTPDVVIGCHVARIQRIVDGCNKLVGADPAIAVKICLLEVPLTS
mmetsp:Transcript_49574/g.139568  ORF Transcript_49574/g.139568 Transcript_49574/m.139568 type:complete len:239 (-) Transcript_49574:260-976(-)